MQPGRLDSIARETRATSTPRDEDGTRSGECGWVLERKYVYVYGIVDYAADGEGGGDGFDDKYVRLCVAGVR